MKRMDSERQPTQPSAFVVSTSNAEVENYDNCDK